MIKIGKGDSMSLLEMAESPVPGDVGKAFARLVVIHDIGHEGVVGRVAGAEVKIEEAVVVEVSKVAAHGKGQPAESQLHR